MDAPTTTPPPDWPYRPGELTVRRNASGHYTLLDPAGFAVATVYGSNDRACGGAVAAVADYARCRGEADRNAADRRMVATVAARMEAGASLAEALADDLEPFPLPAEIGGEG